MSSPEMVLGIDTYRLTPGTRNEFARVVTEASVPLLTQFGIDVVCHGPSEDSDGDDYILIRGYSSAAERTEQEDRFYQSAEWLQGPRTDILSRIQSHHTIVLTVPSNTVALMRLG